jgi:diguanylate cyclase (GGDEF)-like protein
MAYELVTKNIASCKRSGGKSSLILFDIDHFDKINKEFNDLLADELLVQVAQFLNRDLRDSDWLFRFGSDEFLMLLPDCDSDGARNAAGRIRKKTSKVFFEVVDRANDQTTVRKVIHLTLSSSAMCVLPGAIDHDKAIDSRFHSRLRLVDESSSEAILGTTQDVEPLMNQTKVIISKMVDVLAQAKQVGRNRVTMVDFDSSYGPHVDEDAS